MERCGVQKIPTGPTHVTRHPLQPRADRWTRLGQVPVIAWLTGLSGAGKSTLAAEPDRMLVAAGPHSPRTGPRTSGAPPRWRG